MQLASTHQLSAVHVLLRDRNGTHRILRVFRAAGYSGYLRLRSRCDFLFH